MVAKNEKLKAIGKELDRAYEQSEKAYRYNLEVERYWPRTRYNHRTVRKAMFLGGS